MKTDVATVPLADSAVKPNGRHILVCLDRSTFAEVCLPYAVWVARTFGGDITLVHVMEPHRPANGAPATDPIAWEVSRQEAEVYLERTQKNVAEKLGRPVATRIEQGRPAERIVDLEKELAIDLTMLATNGEGDASLITLGSTVQRVLALSRGSVFLAHGSAVMPTDAMPKRILVPLDGSVRSESVLPAAARLATLEGAELLLVHVVQEPLPTGLLRTAEDTALAQKLAERLDAGAHAYLELLQQQLAREVPTVRVQVTRHPNVHQCLLEMAQSERADLILLSAHGAACDPSRSFGSATVYLLTYSKVPLLVLQDLPAPDSPRTQDVEGRAAPTSLRASYAPETV